MIRVESSEFAKMNSSAARGSDLRCCTTSELHIKSVLAPIAEIATSRTTLSDTLPQFRIGNEYADPDEEW